MGGEVVTHPAADIFPPLGQEALAELAEDIRANGLREPVKTWNGQVIDGRNRLAACRIAGVEPRFQPVSADLNPYSFAWSMNGARRDLTQEQRYLIWKDCAEHSADWQDEADRIAKEANEKRAEAAKARERNDDGTLSSGATTSGTTGQAKKPKAPNRNTQAKAKASGTNRGAVERMDNLAKKRPDLAEKVKDGSISAAAAVREMKTAEVVERLEDTAAKDVKAVQGVYDVIVMDPPWPMKKIDRDERPNQVAFDYPTMTESELAAVDVPAADDAHVWVWTTQKFLPMALRLLDRWSLKYVCTFVWHKPGGFQPIGLPQFNCEFAVYARKGSPKFIDTKGFPTCFDAPRGGHSEKPEEFYEIVRRVTAGRRLDMFNRRRIAGFDGWGSEAAE